MCGGCATFGIMNHFKNIEGFANALKEFNYNGLEINSAMVELKVSGEAYHEIEQEFKNAFPNTHQIVDSMKLGIEFNGISFIILFPRYANR